MNTEILKMLTNRRGQFDAFLRKILPQQQHFLADRLQSVSNQDFVIMFKELIVPVKHNPDLIIKVLEEKFGICQKDIKQSDVGTIKAYLNIFCRFVEEVV